MSIWSRNKQKQEQTGKRDTNIIWDTPLLQLGRGKTIRDAKKGQDPGQNPAKAQGHPFWDTKNKKGHYFGTVPRTLALALCQFCGFKILVCPDI